MKKSDRTVSRSARREISRRPFTAESLATVLDLELHLTPDTPLYVAYSGGMDSHVLLHTLVRLRRSAPWRLTALHVDHQLQPRSSEWAQHCVAVCAALQVPLRAERVVVREIDRRGLEDAAREARYAVLSRALPRGAVLLTAHHQDDQAETLLLQLLRGAGIAGLAAMPAIADFANGRLARPLLGFERRALAQYAETENLQWIEDASNRDETLARNFLRHRVWPVLDARWPRAAERLSVAARHQAEAASLVEALGAIDLAGVVDREGDIRISSLLWLTPARRANALRVWIRSRDLPTPSERVLRELLARIEHEPQTRHAVVRWRGAEVRRYRDRLTWMRAPAAAPVDWKATWDPATAIEIPGAGWRLRGVATVGRGIATAKLAGKTLHVRLRRGGERCRINGHTHRLKKLLQQAGIPPWERATLPLVYVGGELAAVADRWVCEPYAASQDEPGVMLVVER